MTTYLFREIALYPRKTGKCSVCGKPAKRSTKIYETVSPFNRNANGEISSVEEIRASVREKCQAWQDAPIMHAKCEPSPWGDS